MAGGSGMCQNGSDMKTIVNISVLIIVAVIGAAIFWMVNQQIRNIEQGKRTIMPDSPPVVIVEGNNPAIRSYSHNGCDWVLASNSHGLALAHDPLCRNAKHREGVARGE
jgi:hypothetical protein